MVREVPQRFRERRFRNGGDELRRAQQARSGVAVHHPYGWKGVGDAELGVHGH
jgi:hypothetical protein